MFSYLILDSASLKVTLEWDAVQDCSVSTGGGGD